MNDLLRLETAPCPCGSPLQGVSEIIGRMDDCFHLQGQQGAQMVTPDVLRNKVVMADPRITDFRVIQSGIDMVELLLPTETPEDAAWAAQSNLRTFFAERGIETTVTVKQVSFALDLSRKLRRVECRVVPALQL